MKQRLDLIILLVVFLGLIGFIAYGPRLRSQPSDPGLPTTRSTQPEGAAALFRWVGALGYTASRLEYRDFEPTENDAALVILNPSEAFTPQEASNTLGWVERGGTLILADDSDNLFGGSSLLFDELQIERDVYTTTADLTLDKAIVAQPSLSQPPPQDVQVQTAYVLKPRRDDVVELVLAEGQPVVIGMQIGLGYAYVSAATFPFTNAGLKNSANSALVQNMLRQVPPGGQVLFDEYHHGAFNPPGAAPATVSFNNPLGWAALYAVLVIAAYLWLSGRRFGQPVPTRAETARRSSAEYVESMADLFQRSGKRDYILKHYHDAFKRRLAKPYGVNPQLDDEAFVREVARFGAVDETVLRGLLRRLSSTGISEDALVNAAADAETTLKQLQIQR